MKHIPPVANANTAPPAAAGGTEDNLTTRERREARELIRFPTDFSPREYFLHKFDAEIKKLAATMTDTKEKGRFQAAAKVMWDKEDHEVWAQRAADALDIYK